MKKIGPLDCEIKEGGDSCVVLFHGYGTGAYDLLPLASFFPKERFTLIFPEGFRKVQIGPNQYGRAWVDVRMDEFLSADNITKETLQKVVVDFRQIDETRKKAIDFYTEVVQKYEKCVLAGFSQGAVLATDLTLHAEKKPKALVLFSGFFMDMKSWHEKGKACQGLPFFQSHGKNDPTLKYVSGLSLEKFLIDSGFEGKMTSFEGVHEIPEDIIKKAVHFIKKNLN